MSDEDRANGSPTLDGRLFDAARAGDVSTLTALLDDHPDKLHVRTTPYEHTLLHLAAFAGQLAAVDFLLERGLDVNTREKGDNTYPIHWAAAAGHLEVVRRLADAGGDVVGHGDDHELGVIGWATCWDGDEAVRRAVADFLVSRGARHHIFSAIAVNLADEVRRIVAADPNALATRMSHNEEYRLPLHHAVLKNRAEMVALLLDLGADPIARDGFGMPPSAYAAAPEIDRRIMDLLVARIGKPDLFSAVVMDDWETAERLLGDPGAVRDPAGSGLLHLMAKRNDVVAVKWLLDRGFDPNARWSHGDAVVTPLHLAASRGNADIVRLLLAAGADPRICDSKHDGDAIGWARFFGQREIVEILTA